MFLKNKEIKIEKTEKIVNGKLKDITYSVIARRPSSAYQDSLYLNAEEFADLKDKVSKFNL